MTFRSLKGGLCFHERAALWRTASYELARTVPAIVMGMAYAIITHHAFYTDVLENEKNV